MCLAERFRGGATSSVNLQVHFLHLCIRYTIVILEEGNRPHPLFLECEIFISWLDLNRRHSNTSL